MEMPGDEEERIESASIPIEGAIGHNHEFYGKVHDLITALKDLRDFSYEESKSLIRRYEEELVFDITRPTNEIVEGITRECNEYRGIRAFEASLRDLKSSMFDPMQFYERDIGQSRHPILEMVTANLFVQAMQSDDFVKGLRSSISSYGSTDDKRALHRSRLGTENYVSTPQRILQDKLNRSYEVLIDNGATKDEALLEVLKYLDAQISKQGVGSALNDVIIQTGQDKLLPFADTFLRNIKEREEGILFEMEFEEEKGNSNSQDSEKVKANIRALVDKFGREVKKERNVDPFAGFDEDFSNQARAEEMRRQANRDMGEFRENIGLLEEALAVLDASIAALDSGEEIDPAEVLRNSAAQVSAAVDAAQKISKSLPDVADEAVGQARDETTKSIGDAPAADPENRQWREDVIKGRTGRTTEIT